MIKTILISSFIIPISIICNTTIALFDSIIIFAAVTVGLPIPVLGSVSVNIIPVK